MELSKIYNEKNIISILTATLLIDAINGVLINILGFSRSPVGIVFRVTIYLYFLIYYVTKRVNKQKLILVCITIIFFVINIFKSFLIYHNSIKGFIFDGTEVIRVTLALVIFLGLHEMFKDKIISKESLDTVLNKSIYILIGVYIISLVLGIGQSSYSGYAGYKAIFVSNNGLNITMIILFIYQFEKVIKLFDVKNLLLLSLLCLMLIMIGSKSSFIFIVFYLICKLVLEYKFIIEIIKSGRLKSEFINKKKWIFMGIAILIVVIIIFNKQILDIISLQVHFIKNELDSIWTYLLSGRDVLLIAAVENLYKNFSLANIFLGIGSYFNQLSIASIIGIYSFKSIEMDLFDIFFSYGIVGVILTYGISMYVLFKNWRKLLNNKRHFEMISILSIFIYSISGGHVFTDAMASTFLGIVLISICIE